MEKIKSISDTYTYFRILVLRLFTYLSKQKGTTFAKFMIESEFSEMRSSHASLKSQIFATLLCCDQKSLARFLALVTKMVTKVDHGN